jgi:hypothetical protein
MMKAAQAREGDHLPILGRFDRSSARRVSVERHVWPVRVIEFRVLANAPKEMTLAEHDQVIAKLATQRPNKPLRVAVLHGDRGAIRS